jgi:sphingomyelin phosphodiesterase acid-like 3
MTSTTRPSFRLPILCLAALAFLSAGFLFMPGALAQGAGPASAADPRSANSEKAEQRSIPAIFVSDVHFDPFHDPAKVKELVAAPVSQWRAILAAPSSSNQEQAFKELQQTCDARGVDTPYALLRSSLQAMRTRQPNAKFMTLSGDLIAHAFDCRYKTVFPGSTPGDYQAFVLKTLSFVRAELRAGFAGMPVYASLGNNDSDCGDYQLDAGSDFLAQAGKIIAQGLPPSQQQEAIKQFGAGGYYAVTMAEPMHDTRLIVVNDLLLSPKYSTCSGKPDSAPATEQMKWLELQLQQARESGQRVWVMGHIPPGIDPFSTVAKFRDVCGGQTPVAFQSSNNMTDLLVEYADVVRLGIFGHTHMDEMRLLGPEGEEQQSAEVHRAVVKVVPSISPVDGNHPSFTVARVNPSSAILENYDVVVASNQTGIATTWASEYDFARTYHEPEFSSSTMKDMIQEFKNDHAAKTPPSQAYLRNYFIGDMSLELSPFWPEYVCAMDNYTASGFAACVCAAPK